MEGGPPCDRAKEGSALDVASRSPIRECRDDQNVSPDQEAGHLGLGGDTVTQPQRGMFVADDVEESGSLEDKAF